MCVCVFVWMALHGCHRSVCDCCRNVDAVRRVAFAVLMSLRWVLFILLLYVLQWIFRDETLKEMEKERCYVCLTGVGTYIVLYKDGRTEKENGAVEIICT